ncbi:aminotransferase-like domain-containing protein [Streptomyces aureocirculatus]|uniref:aminotransferase-like domain-containing protein n=1 Tax=Streptomyces aureocirculatus TaxID=67275 RepID=UPI00068A7DC8|nr:PLP-dependent aminotransferase family protein [Streptomyces aureocirculatus]
MAAPNRRTACAIGGAPGIVQVESDDGLDLRVGQPAPALLPTDLVARHQAVALDRYGPAALAYGANAGPTPAREALAAWTAGAEDGHWTARDVFVTAGASHALALLCEELGTPDARVLVQRASYSVALDLLRRHQLRPLPVGTDDCVPTAAEFTAAARAARRAGERIAFAYLQPTFHNPTGRTWTTAQRRAVVEACADLGVTIVEDDPYRELHFGDPPPPSLTALGSLGPVIGVRTLSKVLAPGLRVGCLVGGAALRARLERAPLFASGGGMAHIGALAAASLLTSPEFPAHLQHLRVEYRERRDALLGALTPAAGAEARWERPGGGFFVWLRLSGGVLADTVEKLSARYGAHVLHGGPFRARLGDGGQAVRVSYSMHSAPTLATAGQTLARAITEASGRNRNR